MDLGYPVGEYRPEKKKPSHEDWAFCLNLVVPERGIEPPTFALRMRESRRFSALTYTHVGKKMTA